MSQIHQLLGSLTARILSWKAADVDSRKHFRVSVDHDGEQLSHTSLHVCHVKDMSSKRPGWWDYMFTAEDGFWTSVNREWQQDLTTQSFRSQLENHCKGTASRDKRMSDGDKNTLNQMLIYFLWCQKKIFKKNKKIDIFTTLYSQNIIFWSSSVNNPSK